MKTLVTFSILILACVLHHYSDASVPNSLLKRCCPNVSRACLDENLVANVVKSNCRVKAILVIKKDKTMACLDPNWEWAKKLLEKFNSTADGTKQMKLDYSQCPRKFVPKKPPAVSQHHKIL